MKPNPLLIISIVFAASFSGRAIAIASAASQNLGGAHKEEAAKTTAGAGEKHEQPASKESTDAGKTSAPEKEQEHAPSAAASNDIPSSLDQPKLSVMLAAIKERSESLDRRETRIVEKEKMLEVSEKRIDQKLSELSAMKTELESRLSFAESAAQNDISQLARMYESMKPQKAGEIFNAMEPSFAAGFLTEMNSESAALILASMETEKAYATSIIIAGRNATVNR